MDIRKQLGELLMVGFMGQEMTADLAAHIRDLQPAGLIFFSRNISAPEQLAQLTRDIQTLALQELGRPLFLAVDQEGGSVARMGPPFTQIPDAVSLGRTGCESVRHYSRLTSREMFQVGLNLNLAPVLDVNSAGSAGVMARRSFGDDPSLVTQCGIAAISASQDENIMATAKHFPGLGRTHHDPHHDLPMVSADVEELERTDLPPFRAAIQADVACVMTSHTLYPALDPDNPGTFSSTILRNLLRAQLGFDGVLITDDLEMGAVVERYSQADAPIAALQAGADLLLVCNDLEKMHLTAEVVLDGLNRGMLDSHDLSLSLTRLVKLRKMYLDPPHLADVATVAAHFST
jgi:beta-N-acetylhexosaminidase